ncbi:hypothetical protein FVR03_01275 [Pontibacter qinzhouensis]|uniref:Uncharacterized protein n=1 Tax=Pontibacter qinzhouensis TaxID=2603253 RepID=A0A5C8KFA5_9BACT|nr:hypothetical protein [Pontibacter qinzhouensis]TXK52375.1 hypothetical protein FVR03_01275 [Pontibacter qinzhouensis]
MEDTDQIQKNLQEAYYQGYNDAVNHAQIQDKILKPETRSLFVSYNVYSERLAKNHILNTVLKETKAPGTIEEIHTIERQLETLHVSFQAKVSIINFIQL